MRRRAPLLAIAPVLVSAVTAHAHVAPATGDNNRYLKLSVLGDRLRVAYTVLYGAVPGAALRKAIDTNHDGAIDDRETRPYGAQIARDVAAAVELTIDGVRQPIAWSQVVVGMGSPSASAGAFSVDLIASICLAVPRGNHTLLFRDAYPIDRPGETEVKLEDSPGVKILRSHIGDADDEAHAYNLVGPSGALERHGLEAEVAIGERALATPDATCPGPHRARALPTPVVAIGLAALAGALLAAASVVLRRRRRTHAPPRAHRAGKRR